MCHARPVHVAQELVPKIKRRLERHDPAIRRAWIGRDRLLDQSEKVESLETFASDVGPEDGRKLGGKEAAALHEIRSGVARSIADDLSHLRADVTRSPRQYRIQLGDKVAEVRDAGEDARQRDPTRDIAK